MTDNETQINLTRIMIEEMAKLIAEDKELVLKRVRDRIEKESKDLQVP